MIMLTDQQIARLFAHLEVPVAIQSILSDGQPLPDETCHALQDLIAAQTPDRALMGLAIGSILLDARLRESGIRSGEILAMSAEMMIQDYAPHYLKQQQQAPGTSLFDGADPDILGTIPEDLESLSDLLSVVADVLPPDQIMFRELTLTMAAQAQSQALIAEAVLDAMGVTADEDLCNLDSEEMNTRPDLVMATPVCAPDNVVPFRRR